MSLVALAALGAAGSAQQHPPAGALDPRAGFWLRPEATYEHFCAPCHGETGEGDGRYYPSDLTPAPARFADPGFHEARDADRLRTAVEQGSAAVGGSSACPAWGATLPAPQLAGLLDLLRGMGPPDPTGPSLPAPPVPSPETAPDSRPEPAPLLLAGGSLLLALGALLQWRRRPLDLCRTPTSERRFP